MQLGGNANAAQFFRQHNCNTTDAQQKYNSRAAQLYRDKLASAATQAMKTFGTTIFIDGTPVSDDKKADVEEDFFAECSNDNQEDGLYGESKPPPNVIANNNFAPVSTVGFGVASPKVDDAATPAGGAPSTDFLNYSEPVEIKSSIGVRKIQSKRGVCCNERHHEFIVNTIDLCSWLLPRKVAWALQR